MQTDLLQAAKHRVPGTSVLINMISMRVRQLIGGQRPLDQACSRRDGGHCLA